MSGSWLQDEHYFTVVPHGWKRETDEQGSIYYLSPDLHKLSSSEELLHYLTTNGTCKCGLRCPFYLEQQFSFSPSVISLEDCHPSRHDSDSSALDPQSLCKATHYHDGTSNTSPQKQVQRNFTPSIRLTRSSAAPKYRRDGHPTYSLTPNSGGPVIVGQKRPALVANLNLANTSGKGKQIKVDSSSVFLNSSGDGKSLNRSSLQSHRFNGHSQRVHDRTTISIKSNSNNNSSLSCNHPSTTSTITTGMNNYSSGVLHLTPSSASQHTFIFDAKSQQKLLSLLAGSRGVATRCTGDGNVLMAVNDQLKIQQSSAEVLKTILCRNECSMHCQEEQICNHVSHVEADGFDSNHGFAHITDLEGGEFPASKPFISNPLMFLANAAEEIESILKTGDIRTNEDEHEGQMGYLESVKAACNLSTDKEDCDGKMEQLRSVETNNTGIISANKEELPDDGVTKESTVCSAAMTLEEALPPISANNEILHMHNDREVQAPSATDTTFSRGYSSPPQGDNPVINSILSSPRASDNLMDTGIDSSAAPLCSENSMRTSELNLLREPQYTIASVSQQISPHIDDKSLPTPQSTSGLAAVSNLPPDTNNTCSSPVHINGHILQQHANEDLCSFSICASKEPPSLMNAEEQKDEVVQDEPPVLGDSILQAEQDSQLILQDRCPVSLSNNDTIGKEVIPSFEQNERVDSTDIALTEATLVDEGLLNLLQKSIDIGDASELITPGEENLVEYCMKMVVDQQMNCSHEDAPSADSAMVDVFQPVKVSKSDEQGSPSNDASTCEENTESADLAVVNIADNPENAQSANLDTFCTVHEHQSMGVSKDAATELPPVPFSDDTSKVNILEENVQSADMAMVSQYQLTGVNEDYITELLSSPSTVGDQPMQVNEQEIPPPSSNAGTCKEIVHSADLAMVLPPVSNRINKNQSLGVERGEGEREMCKSGLSSQRVTSLQVLGSSKKDECDSLSGENLATNEEPGSGLEERLNLIKDHRSCSKENNNNLCMPHGIQLISSNNLCDQDMRIGVDSEESGKYVPTDAALLLITASQAQACESLDHCNTSHETSVSLDEDLSVDRDQQSVPVDQHSATENKSTVCVQVTVNLSPTISVDDMRMKLCETMTAQSSPSQPTSSHLSTTFTAQSQASSSLSGGGVGISQKVGTDLHVEQHSGSVLHCEDIATPCLKQSGDTVSSPISDSVSKDEDMDILPSSISNAMSQTIDSLKGEQISAADQLQEWASDMSDKHLYVETGLHVPVNSDSDESNKQNDIEEVGVRSGVDGTTELTNAQSIELDTRVPLDPELGQLSSVPVTEHTPTHDAGDMDDHDDSVEVTKSTDSHLAQSADSANFPAASELEQQVVPFKEHPPQNDCNIDNHNDEDQLTESTCTHMAQSIEQPGESTPSAYVDSSPANVYKSDHEHMDFDLPHADLATEVVDQDDLSSSNSGIITTSARFRKEWSGTNSDSPSTTDPLSRSGSHSLSNSFNSCDGYSLADSISSSVPESTPERILDDHPRGNVYSAEKTIECEVPTCTSLSSSLSFKRKKSWEPGLYAASKVIMTRSKFADLQKIGDDLTVSQALASPFHDISGESFGSRSPEDEKYLSKSVHQCGRSMSLSSMESVDSACSLHGEENNPGGKTITGGSSSASSLSASLPPNCPYQIGDIVWAKAPQLMAWPGVIISHTERRKDRLIKPPPGKIWVQWIGHSTVSLVELTAIKPLKEGVKHRTKHGKKMPKRLQESINQAMKLLKKQRRNKSVVKR